MKGCLIPGDFVRRITCDCWLLKRLALFLDLRNQMLASTAEGHGLLVEVVAGWDFLQIQTIAPSLALQCC